MRSRCARTFGDCANCAIKLAKQVGVPLPVLSMGMSHDFEVAIEEGATEVRVGTALFGQRPAPKDCAFRSDRRMKLFTPLRIREIELKNRIVVSPMCEYSAKDGHPQPWHMVHLGSRAVGGAALVMTEASAVEERGRISAADTGIYDDAHIESLAANYGICEVAGRRWSGCKLAHAGRKASTRRAMARRQARRIANGGWEPVAPSAIAFDTGYTMPHALERR